MREFCYRLLAVFLGGMFAGGIQGVAHNPSDPGGYAALAVISAAGLIWVLSQPGEHRP